jgi:hypothetical protein
MQSGTNKIEAPQAITIVGRVITSGSRRFISVPADYRELIDKLNAKRVKVLIEPIA